MFKGLLALLGGALMLIGVIVGNSERSVSVGSTDISCGSPWFPKDEDQFFAASTMRQCEQALGSGGTIGWVLIGFGVAIFIGLLFLAAATEKPSTPTRPTTDADQG